VSPDGFPPWSKEVEPRNLVSELFTQGSVGGAAGNCCLYPATRIAMQRLIETGWACGDASALKMTLLAHNRVISSVSGLKVFKLLIQREIPMNLRGSYRALCSNSKAAMLAAIEIYNKPQIDYRDECFTILLINAWELLLKAILSKNKQRIFYPKKRNEPYRTLSIQDSLLKAKNFFPANVFYEPVAQNINMLVTYRNNAIHFYNQKGFGVVIYGLAQTNIINFRDLMLSVFNLDIANEMTISLLPLSFSSQPDPIEFIQTAKVNPPKNKAVAQFLREISQATRELEEKNFDTTRFLTVFTVSLKSIKKVSSADVIVAVKTSEDDSDPLIIEKRVDPNISHPMRQKEVIAKIGSELAGVKFTTYTFQAIVWKYDIKNKPHLYWRSDTGELTRYSAEIPAFLNRLSKDEIESALFDYKENQKRKRKSRR
jgi:hypothetical protein